MTTPIFDTLHRARTSDPATSHQAATVAVKSTAREDVLRILTEHGPLHDHAIEILHEAYRGKGLMAYKSGQRLRTARAGLVDAGLVRELLEHGEVVCVRMPFGWPSTVWEVTPHV